MGDQKTTVMVACTIPGGVHLQMDGSGGSHVNLHGPAARYGVDRPAPVTTEVDAAFMAAWMEKNEKNPMVVRGEILVLGGLPASSKKPVAASGPKQKASSSTSAE